jgi:hypothetical protein
LNRAQATLNANSFDRFKICWKLVGTFESVLQKNFTHFGMKVASVLQKSFTGLITQERVQFANSQPNRTFLTLARTRSVVPQKNNGVSLNRTRSTTLSNTFAQTFPHLKNIRSFSTDDSDSHPDFRAIRKNYENKGRTKEEVQEYIKKVLDSYKR